MVTVVLIVILAKIFILVITVKTVIILAHPGCSSECGLFSCLDDRRGGFGGRGGDDTTDARP